MAKLNEEHGAVALVCAIMENQTAQNPNSAGVFQKVVINLNAENKASRALTKATFLSDDYTATNASNTINKKRLQINIGEVKSGKKLWPLMRVVTR